jgi:hypothetical protein
VRKTLQAAIKLNDGITIIEIDDSIIKMAAIKDGTLFEQQLTPDGDILLKRSEEEKFTIHIPGLTAKPNPQGNKRRHNLDTHRPV